MNFICINIKHRKPRNDFLRTILLFYCKVVVEAVQKSINKTNEIVFMGLN